MTKRNNLGAKIGGWAIAILALLTLLLRLFGVFGKGYEMAKDIQDIPVIRADVDTLKTERKHFSRAMKQSDVKMNLLLDKWNIPIPPDSVE